MAMLAEKKYKSKMCLDPRNTAWTNDTGRFGFKMLEKMGWESGKGLGVNEDGQTAHVKVTKKGDNRGVGAKKSNEDNWLSHQFAFDDLLTKLNNSAQNGADDKAKETKQLEMEKIARSSRKRVFYNKFIKSKDLSSKSTEDMECIFGKRSVSMPVTPVNQSEGEESDDSASSCPQIKTNNALDEPKESVSHGITTVTSQDNIQEYFAKKMQQLKEARMKSLSVKEDTESNTDVDDVNLEKQSENDSDKKEKQKRRNEEWTSCDLQDESTLGQLDSTECCKVEKEVKVNNKKKKRKKLEENDISKEITEVEDVGIAGRMIKKKKKRKYGSKEADFGNKESEVKDDEIQEPRKFKKSKKRKKLSEEIFDEEVENSSECEEGISKGKIENNTEKPRKKSKKNSSFIVESCMDKDDRKSNEKLKYELESSDNVGECCQRKEKKKKVKSSDEETLMDINNKASSNDPGNDQETRKKVEGNKRKKSKKNKTFLVEEFDESKKNSKTKKIENEILMNGSVKTCKKKSKKSKTQETEYLLTDNKKLKNSLKDQKRESDEVAKCSGDKSVRKSKN